MSVSSKNLKTIDKEVVLGMAEALMILNGSTTTLEVKIELRKQGYQATQSAISHFMDLLGEEEKWIFDFNGSYRTYAFERDTDETFHKYLEKDGFFWEIVVKGQEQIIFYGQTGSLGDLARNTFDSNRHAILNARNQIDKKHAADFEELEDIRNLSLDLRLKYFAYFKKEVKEVTLSFFGMEKVERHPIIALQDGQEVEANMKRVKNAGYELYFDHPQGIANLLKRDSWNAVKAGFNDCFLLGEKVMQKQLLDAEGNDLPNASFLRKNGKSELLELNAFNDKLYRIDLLFRDGEVLSLSKFEMDLKRDLLPLAQLILND